ncbi:hypothetical protein QBC46DRAFT_70050 [Diplogelasinospora grovesii]|uniref:Uncharacterized protein n=1 Tax=Diplogelasinospora grovesii TaxID=303347 RepID=A0AAN6RZF3_9PEZI|nr:hypothetical protein QBC46DRAFT_70050 [Diplogelasinospora grovesii]
MGNLCGKESSNDPFAQPGRRLDSAPPAATSSSVPASVSASAPVRPANTASVRVGGPGRTLGSAPEAASGDAEEARRKAAAAAEARMQQANKGTGKLSSQLAAQRKQRVHRTEASSTQLRQRKMDENAQVLSHD